MQLAPPLLHLNSYVSQKIERETKPNAERISEKVKEKEKKTQETERKFRDRKQTSQFPAVSAAAMKICELCKSPAQTYCESDQAILCWTCDAKVHSANFLVARHSRSLLCNECKSPTPWQASGAKLGRTVSVCERCAGGVSDRCESESENGEDLDSDEEDDADEYDEFEDEEEEDREDDDDEEGENQVVPWSSTPPPPAASSSGSDDEFSETVTVVSRKRMRENSPDLHSLDDRCCSSLTNGRSKLTAMDGDATDSVRSLKSRRADSVRTVISR